MSDDKVHCSPGSAGAYLHDAEHGFRHVLRGPPLVLVAPEHADLVLQGVQLPRDTPDPGDNYMMYEYWITSDVIKLYKIE